MNFQAPANSLPPVYPKPTRPIRVLLIDDDPAQTTALASDLEATGSCETCTQNSSIMGLETARTYRPDVIILDICMPLVDGGDMLASLRLDPELRDIKVILCSSLVACEEMPDEGYLMSDGNVIMAKPPRIDKLISCIQRSLMGTL